MNEASMPLGAEVNTQVLEETEPHPRPSARPRRVRLPMILFGLTCVSTFIAGAVMWSPMVFFFDGILARRLMLMHWQDGFIYAGCLLAILLTHEMGHLVATIIYRIPASLPFFVPFPISPLGTMGAVIFMDGMRANRREIFDIGLAGPIAGLCVAVPILWIGVTQLDLTQNQYGMFRLGIPLGVSLMINLAQPAGFQSAEYIWQLQLNPFFMAGWVGLLVTGLNMLPVSQLDGGHVLYALFGRRAHWIARGFLSLALGFMIFAGEGTWIIMFLLVFFLLGPDHPPTSDDRVKLGPFRTALGAGSLGIPVLCFASPTIF